VRYVPVPRIGPDTENKKALLYESVDIIKDGMTFITSQNSSLGEEYE
jgi:hypothetical protein